MLWYFKLRGAASFYEEHGRWPGSPCWAASPMAAAAEGGDHQFSPHIVEQDLPYLRSHVNRALVASEVAVNRVSDDFVHVNLSTKNWLFSPFFTPFNYDFTPGL